MKSQHSCEAKPCPAPHRSLKDDPRYNELKNLILALSLEEMEALRKRLTGENHSGKPA